MAPDHRASQAVLVRVTRWPAAAVVHVEGALDGASMPLVSAVLDRVLDDAPRVVVEMSGVSLLDAYSIGELLGAHRRAGTQGGGLVVRGARGSALRGLHVAGAEHLLEPAREMGPADRAERQERRPEDLTIEYLLRARQELAGQDEHRDGLRRMAISHGMELAASVARRYQGRGEPPEDLRQVAMLGLIKAVDGFDPAHASSFAAYAVPTVTGEIKRYFRDKSRPIRPPRALQETGMDLAAARALLTQQLRRSPTVPELAGHLDVTEEQVLEALEAARAARPASLSTPVGGEDENMVLGDLIGGPDSAIEMVEYRESLRPLLAGLPHRLQRILVMRFYGNLTQSQIAEELGVSQMQISRLLRDALHRLRIGLTA